MEVLYEFQQLTLMGRLLIYLSSLICTFRCFGSDPKYFETISAHEREVDGGSIQAIE
jgi:hypothetical protein